MGHRSTLFQQHEKNEKGREMGKKVWMAFFFLDAFHEIGLLKK